MIHIIAFIACCNMTVVRQICAVENSHRSVLSAVLAFIFRS